MAGSGTNTVIQASTVTPRTAPKMGEAPEAPASRERLDDIREAWAASKYGEVNQAVKGKAAVVASARFGAGYLDRRSGEVSAVWDSDDMMIKEAQAELGEKLANAFTDILERISAGPGGMARLIHELSICYDVEGAAMLVGGWVDVNEKPIRKPSEGVPSVPGAREMFRFVATSRLTFKNGPDGSLVNALDGTALPVGTIVQRCAIRWPDSSTEGMGWVLAALDPIRDLRVFSMAQRSIGKSNVPADLILAPDEANPKPPQTSADKKWSEVVAGMIGEAAQEALTRTNSGGQVVGPVLSVKADFVDKFKRLSLSKAPSTVFAELIDQARTRINEIADEAPEAVSGLGATNRWNGVQIGEQAWRRWYGPMVREIASTLVQGAAGPLLEAEGFTREEIDKCAIWVDASAIIGEPDRADAADQGLKMGAIGHSAWRTARGYKPEDAPTPEEIELLERLQGPKTTEGSSGTGKVNEMAGSGAPKLELPPAPRAVLTVKEAPPNTTGEQLAGAERLFMDRVMSAAQPTAAAMWERLAGRAKNQARSLGIDVGSDPVFAALAAQGGGALERVLSAKSLQASDAPGASGDELETETEDGASAWWLALLAIPFLGGRTPPAGDLPEGWAATAGQVARSDVTGFVEAEAIRGAEKLSPVPATVGRKAMAAAAGEPVPEGLGPEVTKVLPGGTPMAESVQDLFGAPNLLVWRYGQAHRAAPFVPHVHLDGREVPIDGVIPDSSSPWGGWWVGDHRYCRCRNVASYDYLYI